MNGPPVELEELDELATLEELAELVTPDELVAVVTLVELVAVAVVDAPSPLVDTAVTVPVVVGLPPLPDVVPERSYWMTFAAHDVDATTESPSRPR
jgi:hypothetical protein